VLVSDHKKKVENECIRDEILKWMSGVTRENRIRNEYVRGCIGVGSIVDKMKENRLRWLSYVIRRKDSKQ